MTTTELHFSPCNQLLDEAKDLCKEIHPVTFGFPRWMRRGGKMWVESSSGSTLMTVDFDEGTVTVPAWKVERDGVAASRPMPERWADFYRGSLFKPDGSANDREAFEAASAAWVRGRRAS